MNRRATTAALAAILLIACGVRLFELGRAPLWLDEQGQLEVAQTASLETFWTMSGGPIGRLSYVDSWLAWHAGANTRALFRLPSVIWGVASILMIFVLGRRWFSTTTGLCAAGFASASGLHIQYSREARGYALLVFLSALWAWQLDRFIEKPTRIGGALLFVAATAALQVHPVFLPFMCALSAAMLASLWLGENQKPTSGKMRLTLALGAIVLASCAIFFLSRRSTPVITPGVSIHTESLSYLLFDIYKSLLGGYWGITSYPVAALAALGIVISLKNSKSRRGMLAVLAVSIAAALPLVYGYHTGMWIASRYALTALPFILLAPACGMAALLERFKFSESANAIIAIALPIFLLSCMALQSRSPYDMELYKKHDPARATLDK